MLDGDVLEGPAVHPAIVAVGHDPDAVALQAVALDGEVRQRHVAQVDARTDIDLDDRRAVGDLRHNARAAEVDAHRPLDRAGHVDDDGRGHRVGRARQVGQIPTGHRRLQDRAEIDGGSRRDGRFRRGGRGHEGGRTVERRIGRCRGSRRFVNETDGWRSRCLDAVVIRLRARPSGETLRRLNLCHVLSPSYATQSKPVRPARCPLRRGGTSMNEEVWKFSS